jgi:hypothetical protein
VPGLEFRVLGAVEVWLVAAHPFRESLVAQLMLAQYRAGRPADALATYDVLRRRLREELGADPDRTLRDLHATILSAGIIGGGEPAGAPGPGHGQRQGQPRWTGRGPSPGPLTGRDADQRALAQAVRAHRAVTLVGPPGVGKTELALHTAGCLAAGFADGVAVAELGMLPAQRTDDPRAVSRCAEATTCWTSRAGCCSPGSRSSPAPSAWPTPSTPAPTLDWR